MQDPLELEHVIGYTGAQLHTLVAHPTIKNCFCYPIGSVVVVADLQDPHNQQFLRGHDEEISTLCFSPSGNLLASGQFGSTKIKGNIATICVWDFKTKECLLQLQSLTGEVTSLAFSHDDRFLAGTGDERVCIWDLENGQLAGGFRIAKDTGGFVKFFGRPQNFNPRRPHYLFVTGSENQLQIHDWYYDVKSMNFVLQSTTCTLPGRKAGFKRMYYDCTLDPTNVHCYAGNHSGEVVVFNAKHRIFKKEIPISSNGIHCICYVGNFLFIGSGDATIKKLKGFEHVWHVAGETVLKGNITSLSPMAGGTELIVGTNNGKIFIVETETLKVTQVAESHIAPLTHVSFDSKSSEIFCTASADGTLRLWDLSDYKTIATLTGPCEATCCIYFDDHVLSGWKDGFIRMYDVKNKKLKWQIVNAHRGAVTCLAYGGKYLISGGEDAVVRLWSPINQELIVQFTDHIKTVTSIIIDSKLPNTMHSCSMDKTIVSRDIKSAKRICFQSLKHSLDKGMTCLTQAKDGEYEIISSGADGKIRYWDIDYQDQVKVLSDPNSKVCITCIEISPSGKYLAAGGDDQLVKVWDLKSGKVISQGVCHSETIRCVRWSPDEKQLISVGDDCAICVWNFYA